MFDLKLLANNYSTLNRMLDHVTLSNHENSTIYTTSFGEVFTENYRHEVSPFKIDKQLQSTAPSRKKYNFKHIQKCYVQPYVMNMWLKKKLDTFTFRYPMASLKSSTITETPSTSFV